MGKSKKKKGGKKPQATTDSSGAVIVEVVRNKKAKHDFVIEEKYEAGIQLVGTEVKSLRLGRVTLTDAYARIEDGQIFLHGCDIQPYEMASFEQHRAKRPRRLLMHKREIAKLFGQTQIKGNTLVALRIYFKNQRAKVEIGVGHGKGHADRREDLKKAAHKREVDREMARFNRK